jgi:hypothetical protein
VDSCGNSTSDEVDSSFAKPSPISNSLHAGPIAIMSEAVKCNCKLVGKGNLLGLAKLCLCSVFTCIKLDGSEYMDESSEGSLVSDSEVEDKEPMMGEFESELMDILVLKFRSERDKSPFLRTPSKLLNSCPVRLSSLCWRRRRI